MTTYTLPWPPSSNHYWVHTRRGAFIGKRGVEFRAAVFAEVRRGKRPAALKGNVRAVIAAFPPDKRRRDLDNILKGLMDALTHSGVYYDDSQVKELTVRMMEPVAGGRVEVMVELIPGAKYWAKGAGHA